jgi:hypothetical protein
VVGGGGGGGEGNCKFKTFHSSPQPKSTSFGNVVLHLCTWHAKLMGVFQLPSSFPCHQATYTPPTPHPHHSLEFVNLPTSTQQPSQYIVIVSAIVFKLWIAVWRSLEVSSRWVGGLKAHTFCSGVHHLSHSQPAASRPPWASGPHSQFQLPAAMPNDSFICFILFAGFVLTTPSQVVHPAGELWPSQVSGGPCLEGCSSPQPPAAPPASCACSMPPLGLAGGPVGHQ